MNNRQRLDRTENIELAKLTATQFGCAYLMLGHGKFALIDHKDAEKASTRTWCCDKKGYVVGSIKHQSIFLHRFLLDFPVGFEIDHANHDTLDNRRCNLRIATRSQNFGNKRKTVKNSSDYKGVYRRRGQHRWLAVGGRNRLGVFDTEQEAAQAYNQYAKVKWGEFALLNPV